MGGAGESSGCYTLRWMGLAFPAFQHHQLPVPHWPLPHACCVAAAAVLCATAVFLLLRSRKARLRAVPTAPVMAPAANAASAAGIDSKLCSDLTSIDPELASPAAPMDRPAPDSRLPLDGGQIPASWNASMDSGVSAG